MEYGMCIYARKIVSDPEAVPFVAKLQKAKTRKNKDYFVLRATVPKEIAEKIGVKPGDFLFFRAKKAKWYHMLNWEAMENTWNMLPGEVKNKVITDGLYGQSELSQVETYGATNPSASPSQVIGMIRQYGELHGNSI